MERSYHISAFGRVYDPPNWYYNPNYLINRIYYIVKGTAYYNNDIRLKPGFIYVFGVDPDFRVSQDPTDPVDHAYFDFISFHRFLNTKITEIDLSKYSKLKHLILAMAEEFSSYSSLQIANAYFELISTELENILGSGEKYNPITEKVLEIIHSCPVNELTIKEIASKVSLNENYLIRTFHSDIGVTPYKYLALYKADLAMKYSGQGKKLQEIADILGYSSVSSLSYSFKRITGKNLSRLFERS